MPVWVQVLIAIAQLAIGGAVGIVALMQWRTAHEKVLLDLFDRRLKTFYAVIDAMQAIAASETLADGRLVGSFRMAARDALFLFGDDVSDYLEDVRQTLKQMASAERFGQVDASQIDAIRLTGKTKINQFFIDYPRLCEPYLKLDQKKIRWTARTPRWLQPSGTATS